MSADFGKNFYHFVNEIAPGIPALEGCEFSFDYEKKKLKIHCKDRQHRIEVNENVESYLLFLPGEYFHLVIPDHDEKFLLRIELMIEYHKSYIGRNPNHPRQYFYF